MICGGIVSVVWVADNRYRRLLINQLVQDFSDAELAEVMDYWFIFSVTAIYRAKAAVT